MSDPLLEDSPQVSLVDRNQEIEKLAADSSYKAFAESLVESAEPAEWDQTRYLLFALLARFRGRQQVTQSRGIDRTRTNGVHANAAIL
jgi:hypothetical protein